MRERRLFHYTLKSTTMNTIFNTCAAYVLTGVERRPILRWQYILRKIRLLKRLIGG